MDCLRSDGPDRLALLANAGPKRRGQPGTGEPRRPARGVRAPQRATIVHAANMDYPPTRWPPITPDDPCARGLARFSGTGTVSPQRCAFHLSISSQMTTFQQTHGGSWVFSRAAEAAGASLELHKERQRRARAEQLLTEFQREYDTALAEVRSHALTLSRSHARTLARRAPHADACRRPRFAPRRFGPAWPEARGDQGHRCVGSPYLRPGLRVCTCTHRCTLHAHPDCWRPIASRHTRCSNIAVARKPPPRAHCAGAPARRQSRRSGGGGASCLGSGLSSPTGTRCR